MQFNLAARPAVVLVRPKTFTRQHPKNYCKWKVTIKETSPDKCNIFIKRRSDIKIWNCLLELADEMFFHV